MDRYRIEFMIMSFWHENYCTHVIQNKSFAHQHFYFQDQIVEFIEAIHKAINAVESTLDIGGLMNKTLSAQVSAKTVLQILLLIF